MNELKLLEVCKKCGANLILMGSLRVEDSTEWAVKRCLNCGGHYAEEVVRLYIEQQEKNEPLSLDELKQMDGEPVWCVDTKGNGKWALVHTCYEICTDADCGDWEFYSYGWMDSDVGWVAYRHKKGDV